MKQFTQVYTKILCLFTLLTIGVNSMWGATATIANKATSTSADNITFSLSGTHRVEAILERYAYIKSGEEFTLDWTVPTGYTISVTQIDINAKMYNKNGSGRYKTSKNSSYSQFCTSTSWDTYTLNSSSYFSLGNEGSISIKAFDKEFDYKAITLTYTKTANKYDVTLKPNGGSGEDQMVEATYDAAMPTTLKAGGSISAPNKEGYTFSGYYDAKKDGVQYYKADLSSAKNWDKTGNTNLFAHWTANTYTIVYDANGGTGTTNSSSHTYDVAKTLTKNGYSKTGYSFVGWATSKALADAGTKAYDNEQSVINLSATQEATITLYAIWTVNNYKIYLNNQSATTPGTEIVEVTYDSNVNLTSGITPPTKTNCTFEGYYTDAGCIETKRIDKNGAWQEANGFIVDGKWNCAGDVTLYAYWKQNQTITWEWTPEAGVEYTTGTVFDATTTSGLTVYYTSSNEDIAKIVDGNKLLVVTPNAEVTITAHQNGNHDWNKAPTESKTFTTLGATPDDWSAVSATDITYGMTLSESNLSGAVKVNGVTIAGTFAWLEPTTLPNAGANQPFAVRFTPDNLAAYSAIEFYVKVNVDKATPVFTWNISNILRENVRYSNFVTSTNKESAISSYASPSTYITASGVTLTTSEVDDVVNNIRIIVMQGTTDNYVAKNETLMVSIYPKSESCLPFNPMTGDDFNNKTISGTNGNVEWYNTNDDGYRENYILWFDVTYTQRVGIGLGSWEAGLSGISVAGLTYLISTGKFKYDAKSVDLSFSGIPDRISFDVESQTVTSSPPDATWPATAPQWALYQSVDGKNYGDPIASRDGDGSISYQFTNENVRFVRIEYTGNFTGFVKNLRITQKKSLTSDKNSLTFGTETHPLQEPQTIKISYSSLGVCGGLNDAITITSSNPAFYVDETSITENVGLELKGEYTVRVRCNDVNQSGKIIIESNDGTQLEVPVSSTKPTISALTAGTAIFQTGTERAPYASTPYRALRTHNFATCFDADENAIFDALYIYGVSESSAANRQWSYDASKGYNVPTISTSNVHTPCFVYKKDGKQYTYDRTFDASTQTLNIADSKKHIFVGYKPESSAATAIQVSGANAKVYLNHTEIIATGAPLAVNATSAVYANEANIISSTGNAAIQLLWGLIPNVSLCHP